MQNVGVIGYGDRIRHMIPRMRKFGIAFRLKAIADPGMFKLPRANDQELSGVTMYETADEMLERERLSGVMIGTRCNLHAEMACKVARYGIPLFLEKPVAISFEQLETLAKAFSNNSAPTVVSFPLRLSPLFAAVMDIVNSGRIGSVKQIAAFNDVTYGNTYFSLWYRNYEETGGLFLQKMTHDIDCVASIAKSKPRTVCAMSAQSFYGGDKPHDLRCVDCGEYETCLESPFNWFYKRKTQSSVEDDRHLSRRMCVFSQNLKNEDIGQCLIEYENGILASYTQNFFVRNHAGRRGARVYGTEGTLEFDWLKGQIQIFTHISPTIETIELSSAGEHFGGDMELSYDFLLAMREGKASRSDINAGIESALVCLCARKSAESKMFVPVGHAGGS